MKKPLEGAAEELYVVLEFLAKQCRFCQGTRHYTDGAGGVQECEDCRDIWRVVETDG